MLISKFHFWGFMEEGLNSGTDFGVLYGLKKNLTPPLFSHKNNMRLKKIPFFTNKKLEDIIFNKTSTTYKTTL